MRLLTKARTGWLCGVHLRSFGEDFDDDEGGFGDDFEEGGVVGGTDDGTTEVEDEDFGQVRAQ